jgi:ribonuclease HI
MAVTKITFNKKITTVFEPFSVWIYGEMKLNACDASATHGEPEARLKRGTESLEKGSWRVVIKSESSCDHIHGVEENTNIDRIQLHALLEAIKWIHKTTNHKKVILNTESLYVKNCICEWIDLWKRNDFIIEEETVRHTVAGKKKKHSELGVGTWDRRIQNDVDNIVEQKNDNRVKVYRPNTDLLRQISSIITENKLQFIVRTTPDPVDTVMTELKNLK